MRKSSLTVKLLIVFLIPFFAFCAHKNAQKAGKTEKSGEAKPDTSLKTAPKDYNQRVIHNSDDPKTVDSLKKVRGKDKKTEWQ